jgi:hypothetical protein
MVAQWSQERQMCGSKSNTTTQQVQLPAYLQDTYQNLISAGTAAANKPLQQYSGPTVAGFTPMQKQAFKLTQQAQGMGIPYINAAQTAFQNASGQAAGVTAPYYSAAMGDFSQAKGSAAGALTPYFNQAQGYLGQAGQEVYPQLQKYNAENLQQYMDPYTQNVIDTTMANVLKNNAVAQQGLKGTGMGMGVSPTLGDRMGLGQAELERNQGLARDQTIAGLESQGFQNAQQQLLNQQNLQASTQTADYNRMLGIGQTEANMGATAANVTTSDLNRILAAGQATGQLGTDLANVTTSDLNRQLSVGQGELAAGNQAQNQAYQGINALLSQGAQKQQLNQIQLDQAKANFQQQQDYPQNQISWLANLAYGTPHGTTTTTTQPPPSILSQIAGAATAGLGLAGVGRKRGGVVPHMDDGGVATDTTPAPLFEGGPIFQPIKFRYLTQDNWRYQPPTTPFNPYLPQLNPADMMPNGPWTTALPAGVSSAFDRIAAGVAPPAAAAPAAAPAARGQGSSSSGTKGKRALTDGSTGRILFYYGDGGVVAPGVHMAPGGNVFDPYDASSFWNTGIDSGIPDAPTDPRYSSWPTDPGVGAGVTPPPAPPVPPVPVPTGVSVDPRVAAARTGGFGSHMNMPLLYAGLGMMSSSSPFPLQGIGEGAMKGLATASELDKNPVVDDSGPTVRVFYPSEHKWEDTGIPSTKYAELHFKQQLMGYTPQPLTDAEMQQYGITADQVSKYGRPYWDLTPTGKAPKFPATGGGTNINLVGETAQEKSLGSLYGKRQDAITQASVSAQDTINNIEEIKTLLAQPGVVQGTAADQINEVKKWGATLFPNKDWKGVAEPAAASALMNQFALKLRNPGQGAGMPGSLSDSDRVFLTSMAPRMTNLPASNALIMDWTEKLARRNIDIERLRESYVNSDTDYYGNPKKRGLIDSGFEAAVNDFAMHHPLVTPEEKSLAVKLVGDRTGAAPDTSVDPLDLHH